MDKIFETAAHGKIIGSLDSNNKELVLNIKFEHDGVDIVFGLSWNTDEKTTEAFNELDKEKAIRTVDLAKNQLGLNDV